MKDIAETRKAQVLDILAGVQSVSSMSEVLLQAKTIYEPHLSTTMRTQPSLQPKTPGSGQRHLVTVVRHDIAQVSLLLGLAAERRY